MVRLALRQLLGSKRGLRGTLLGQALGESASRRSEPKTFSFLRGQAAKENTRAGRAAEKNTRIWLGRCRGCFGLSGTQHFFFGYQPVLHCVSIQAATFFIQLIRTLADLFFDFGIGWFGSDWDRSLGTHGGLPPPRIVLPVTALCKVTLRSVTLARGEQCPGTSASRKIPRTARTTARGPIHKMSSGRK